MRLLLLIIMLTAPFPLYAEIIPAQKPVEYSAIPTPAKTPERKRPSLQTAQSSVPIPQSKPLAIRPFERVLGTIVRQPSPPTLNKQQRKVVSFDNDRMAGGNRFERETERTRAKPRTNLQETHMASPFKQNGTQKAKKTTSQEPVILFFTEQSSEMEVGQMDVLENDVLRNLQRRSTQKAIIFGYASSNKNPDLTRKTALSRALMVREYLVDNRINPDRLEVRAMGDDTPINPKDRVDIIFN